MYSTLAAQLAQLELGHLSISRTEPNGATELPDSDAVEQTLAGVWSDLLTLFPETAIEDDAEEIGWGFVNLFHRAATKRSAQIDRATNRSWAATTYGYRWKWVGVYASVSALLPRRGG